MGGVATGASVRDIDSLIEDAFSGRELTAEEVQAIAEHVAAAGFDPSHRVAAGKRLIGIIWQGQTVQRQTSIPTAEAHYLRHVIVGREWAGGTSLEQYLESAAAVARNPSSGVFISHYDGRRAIGIVGDTPVPRGIFGAPLTLVEYRVMTRRWTTAFQLQEGIDYLVRQNRKDFRWLRERS